MTDHVLSPKAWVPRYGVFGLPDEHLQLTQGLFQLAAWVAEHPEVPAPCVEAWISPSQLTGAGRVSDCRAVDRVAAALGVEPEYCGDLVYMAHRWFGPIEFWCDALPPHAENTGARVRVAAGAGDR